MSFHNPGAWLWICLAAPIAIFYLWHFTSRRHEVATYSLWQRAIARRPAWFVLRFWLSLAAQVFILLLIVAALAEPYWKAVFDARRNIALVVDVSASMSATDGQSSRFEAMREEAKRLTNEMRRGERMMLVSAGSLIRTECRLTDDQEALLDAIESLEPTDGSTRIRQAVELAQSVLEGQSNLRIIVLADGAFPGAVELATAEDVQMVLFGEGAPNAAITRIAASPDPIESGQYQVFVEVANFSADDMDCPLVVSVEGSDPQTVVLHVPAGASVQEVVPYTVAESGLISARLQIEDGKDGLAADNEAHVFVQSRQRPVIKLVVGASQTENAGIAAQQTKAAVDQIRNILQSNPQIDVLDVDDASPTPSGAITVWYGQVPNQLPAGPVMVFEPKGSCDLWDEAEDSIKGQSAAVKTASLDSPLLSGVDFTGVVVEEAARLQFKIAAQTIVASASGDSLYSTIERSEGRVVVLHVKLAPENSDLTLRTDFPVLIANAMRWPTPAWESHRAAATTDEVISLAGSDSKRSLRSEDAEVDVAAGQSIALLDRTGVWKLPTSKGENQGNGQSVLPSNLTNSSESDLRIRDGAKSDKLTPVEPINDQPLWMLLIGVAIVLLFVEWCLYHRRVLV
ncbi:MAG: VWA domain-containing protein [Planctomycetes bacterium]|nr:VWA domain-containing protein [Planctomycetota bacterium]MBL7040956.1 BatA and WFA domain-containing protein [Pirellulaceae bacterium]